MAHGHELGLAALASWLLTEALGAVMLRNWLASGGARAAQAARSDRARDPDAMSVPILAAHAGLNLAGFASWLCYVLSGMAIFGWVALGFMAPAIGLGISTIAIWTPYPVRRAPAVRPGILRHDDLRRALDDDGRSEQIVDDLLRRNLTPPVPPRPNPRALIPAGHGILAIATFLLVVLAVISAGLPGRLAPAA